MSGQAVPVEGSVEVGIQRGAPQAAVTPQVQPTAPVTPVAPVVTVEPTVNPSVQPTPQVEPTPNIEQPKVEVPKETYTDAVLGVLNLDDDAVADSMGKALQYGDPDLINLGDLTKGKSEKEAEAIERVVKAKYAEVQAHIKSQLNEVHTLAGGADKWAIVQQSFNTNAPDYIRATVGQMIENGDLVNAAKTAMHFAQTQGLVNTQQGNAPIQGGTSGVDSGGITYAEMKAGLVEIQRKYPRADLEGSGEAALAYQALVAKRNIGIQLGK